MNFDLTISADDTGYLNPEFYLLASSLIDNLPDDTILHVTTNRSDDDKAFQFLKDSVNVEIYKRPKLWHLKSRCSYLLHSFKIDTDKDWVIKLDVDVLALKHLKEFDKILDKNCDVIISPENRRIINDDNLEKRLWRLIYTKFGMEPPNWKIQFVEDKQYGLPLFNTGVIAVKSELLDRINEQWIPWTMICEDWIQYGIHPNEFGFTAMIIDNRWKWKQLDSMYHLNPISIFRKGEFPSQELIPNAVIPRETVLLHWHKPNWFKHLSLYNSRIKELIDKNKDYIPDEWWNLPVEIFMERNYNACGFYI